MQSDVIFKFILKLFNILKFKFMKQLKLKVMDDYQLSFLFIYF